MHPAYSIIFFTTASGIGYGMLMLLGLLAAAGLLPASTGYAFTTLLVALLLVTAGLVSSTYHLGHPERAWRAFSQWRTSWLSREGVCAVVTYVPALLFAAAWVFVGAQSAWVPTLGLATAVAALATVVCTGMIYASIAAVPRWDHGTVPIVYLVLGLMNGALWLYALARIFGLEVAVLPELSVGLILAGAGFKLAYWDAVGRRDVGSTVESATGLGNWRGEPATATTLDPPHTERNYIQREMGYQIARKHAQRLREHSMLLAFALPLMLSLLALGFSHWAGGVCALVAALLATLGVVVERWLFFAEAEHKVTLYYGARAV